MSQLWHRGECFLSTQSSLWQVCTCCAVTQRQVLPVTPALSELVIAVLRASQLLSPWFTPVCFLRVFSFTAYFYAHCFIASSLPLYAFSRKTCSLFFFFIAERHALCFSPHRYRWESFACRWLVGAGFGRSVAFDAGWLGQISNN